METPASGCFFSPGVVGILSNLPELAPRTYRNCIQLLGMFHLWIHRDHQVTHQIGAVTVPEKLEAPGQLIVVRNITLDKGLRDLSDMAPAFVNQTWVPGFYRTEWVVFYCTV